MKKASLAVVLALVIGTIFTSIGILGSVYAQYDSSGRPSSGDATTTTNTTQTAAEGDTFAANGRIGSLIFDAGVTSETSTSGNMTGSTMSNETSIDTTIAEETELPYIVVGDWNLSVVDGNVTDFSAGFDMVHTDGTERHNHDLSNFQASEGTTVQLVEDGTTWIVGTADLSKNDEPMATGVDVTISIERLNATSIMIVHEHFQDQPLYGTVDLSIGTDLASDVAESAENVANETGGFLEDIAEGIIDFFNGTDN